MNCKMIQDLLLTDYIDGEMNEEAMTRVKAHLEACQECAQFERLLRETAVKPFKGLSEIQPPPAVWSGIEQAIHGGLEKTQTPTVSGLDWLQEKLGMFFPPRRVAYALAATMIILALAIAIVPRKHVANPEVEAYLTDQADFLSSLDNRADHSDMGVTETLVAELIS